MASPVDDPKLRRKKRWRVYYCHYKGEIGSTPLLTYRQATKKRDELLADRQFLDWFEIVYCPGGPLHEL